jgi:hypothetical protein
MKLFAAKSHLQSGSYYTSLIQLYNQQSLEISLIFSFEIRHTKFISAQRKISISKVCVGGTQRDRFPKSISARTTYKKLLRAYEVQTNPPRHFISWQSSLGASHKIVLSARYLLICTDVNACEMRAASKNPTHKDKNA